MTHPQIDEAKATAAVKQLRTAFGLPEAMIHDSSGQVLPARGQLFGVLIEMFGSILNDPDVRKVLIDLLLGVFTRSASQQQP
jgi:hypothetical protein